MGPINSKIVLVFSESFIKDVLFSVEMEISKIIFSIILRILLEMFKDSSPALLMSVSFD